MNDLSICRDISELRKDFQVLLANALQDARKKGLEPVVIETHRTQARQNHLYSLGRSTEGSKVTWTKNSKHTERIAADVCPSKDGIIDWMWKEGFDEWGKIAKAHGLKWGGDFSTYDGAHVEIDE